MVLIKFLTTENTCSSSEKFSWK